MITAEADAVLAGLRAALSAVDRLWIGVAIRLPRRVANALG